MANLIKARATTTTALAGNGTYDTGDLHLTVDIGRITVSVFADQTGSLQVLQSIDGTHWDIVTTVAVAASTGQGVSVEALTDHQRVLYTNGATGQGTFRLGVYARAVS